MENNLMPIVLSSRFRDILMKIGDNLSNFIISLENNGDYAFPFSYIDITEDESSVSFLSTTKYFELPRERGNGDLAWTCSYRNEMRLGRLINRIAPCYKHAEIEKLINAFKAEHKNSLKKINFKIVEGNDIVKYYNGRRYGAGNGPLNKSCMRHEQCGEWMTIYTQNSNKIKMLLLMETKDTISGRALLWKLDEPANTWFLDRIYAKDDSDVILFKKYAQKNGWIYKNSQTFDAINVVKDGKETFVPMKVNIKGDHRYFPYIDTLHFYNKKDNYLTNIEKDYENFPSVIKLREINGRDSGNEYFVFDVLHNEYINIEDSQYCFYGDGYTHKNYAFFMKESDEYIYPSELRYSKHHKKFLRRDNSVFSKSMNSFVHSNDVCRVFFSKDKSIYDYILRDGINNNFANVHDEYFSMDLLVKGIDEKYYFKDEYNEEKIKQRISDEIKIVEDVVKSSKYIRDCMKIKEKKESKKAFISWGDDDFWSNQKYTFSSTSNSTSTST